MNYGSSNQGSRSEMRGKRRRTNVILNILIVLVILLIVIVSAIIFLGGNDEKSADKKVDNQIENKQDDNKEHAVDSEKEKEKEENNTVEDKQPANQQDKEQQDEEKETSDVEKDLTPANEETAVVTDGSSNQNIKRTIENSSWQPIGTSQTGEHTTVFDKESVDWKEMLQAMTYATGVEESNMTVWFLGNNGHNRAAGTIVSKNTKEKFRVYLDWVDGQGWKPTKVEELNEIEKKKE